MLVFFLSQHPVLSPDQRQTFQKKKEKKEVGESEIDG